MHITAAYDEASEYLTMRDLLIATSNKGKLREILVVLKGIPFKILTLADVDAGEDIEETGATLEENAVLKATTYAKRTGLLTLAEDTGLQVDALNGAPGVHSARYGPDDTSRNIRLLEELVDVPEENRMAIFRTVAAIHDPLRGTTRVCEGICKGRILRELRGDKSFGYGPLFFADELGKTYAEAEMGERTKVSQRGRALAKVRDILIAEFA